MDYKLMSNTELSAKFEEMETEYKKAQAQAAIYLKRMDETALAYQEIRGILIKRNVITE